jgi:hypothetical protein
MIFPNSKYEIFVCDSYGNVVAPFNGVDFNLFVEFSATRAVGEIGACYLRISGGSSSVNVLSIISRFGLLQKDSILAIYRTSGTSRSLLLDTVWFVRTIEQYRESTGSFVVKITAYDTNYLLGARITSTRSDTVQKDVQYPFVNTYPSNIMYQLVYDNIGTGAGVRRASNFSESLPISNYGYSINAITGNTDGIYFFFMNLYDAVKQLSDLTLNPIDIDKPALPIYFDVVAVSPSSFVFTQYPQQRGSDRRFRVGIANATILSDAKGQLRDVRFVADWKEEKTVVIPVAQSNTNGNNTVSFEYVADVRRVQNSPYSRREIIANTTIGNFAGEGKKELKNPANFPTFSAYATLQDAPGFMYGIDWNYGDYFTINVFGTVVDARINAITISVTNKSEQFDVSLQVSEEISF